MSLSGIIGMFGVFGFSGGFGDVIFLAKESGDLILQETGDKLIV